MVHDTQDHSFINYHVIMTKCNGVQGYLHELRTENEEDDVWESEGICGRESGEKSG